MEAVQTIGGWLLNWWLWGFVVMVVATTFGLEKRWPTLFSLLCLPSAVTVVALDGVKALIIATRGRKDTGREKQCTGKGCRCIPGEPMDASCYGCPEHRKPH